MKKAILAISLIAFLFLTGDAQNKRFGLKGGINSSSLNTTGNGATFTSDSKIGFYAGAFAQLGIAQYFAVQPEIMYSLLGAKYKYLNVTINRNLSYISVPVLASYIKDGLSIIVGPQISFLAAAKDKGANISADVKSQFEIIEIAGVVGGGYTTQGGLGFDARYHLGLTDIVKDNSTGYKLKNNNFQFGIHFTFHR
ncbi:MAG: porin family protein [Ginsengibacter sp.]